MAIYFFFFSSYSTATPHHRISSPPVLHVSGSNVFFLFLCFSPKLQCKRKLFWKQQQLNKKWRTDKEIHEIFMALQPAKFQFTYITEGGTVGGEWTESSLHSDAITIFNEKFHIYRKCNPPFIPSSLKDLKENLLCFCFLFFFLLVLWMNGCQCQSVWKCFICSWKRTENIKSTLWVCLSLHHIYNMSFPSSPSAGSVLSSDMVYESVAPSGSPRHLQGRKKCFLFFFLKIQLWSTVSHSIRNTKQTHD